MNVQSVREVVRVEGKAELERERCSPPPEEEDDEQRVKEQFVRETEEEEELDAKIERAPPDEEDEQWVNAIFSSVMLPLSAIVMEIAPPPPLEHAHS